jgi:hypothetical protein
MRSFPKSLARSDGESDRCPDRTREPVDRETARMERTFENRAEAGRSLAERLKEYGAAMMSLCSVFRGCVWLLMKSRAPPRASDVFIVRKLGVPARRNRRRDVSAGCAFSRRWSARQTPMRLSNRLPRGKNRTEQRKSYRDGLLRRKCAGAWASSMMELLPKNHARGGKSIAAIGAVKSSWPFPLGRPRLAARSRQKPMTGQRQRQNFSSGGHTARISRRRVTKKCGTCHACSQERGNEREEQVM